MNVRKLTIFIAGLLVSVSLYAQENFERQTYEEALSEYEIGRIEQTVDILLENMPRFQGTIRQSAYRLLTLCALSEDDEVKAEYYADLLLDENPYYTPSAENPQLFVEIINRLKASRTATITTASRVAESLHEAPVPVTLITEEMIRQSTATNLQELLAEYVPGMTVQEGREAVVGMRGVFTIDQETILIMRDGVRLNSHITNSISADSRIALSNVKQIEVLRGPASSLYGNVALSAVVNIITKSGASVDGIHASIGGGNMHTVKGDLLLGRQVHDGDLLVWGSVYNSRGYRYDFPADSKLDAYSFLWPKATYIYVNGYNKLPAYDVGLNYSYKDFGVYFSHQNGRRTMPYSSMLSCSYSPDDYPSVDGVKPGLSLKTSILNLKYGHTWNKWAVEANVTGSLESSVAYEPEEVGESKFYYGNSIRLYCVGADAKVVYNYPSTVLGEGSVLFGMQAEALKLYDYEVFNAKVELGEYVVYNYDIKADSIFNTTDTERLFSVFSQLKHQFSPNLILNAGFRYDYKKRYGGEFVNQFSPRAALIWTPSKNTNLKLAYGHSFVDLSVANRLFWQSRDIELKENEPLHIHPSVMDNVQLSAAFNIPKLNMRYESCIFYNNTKKIRLIDLSYITKDMTLTYYFFDAYSKSIGWENVLSYEQKGFKARLTAYLQRVIDNKIAAVDETKYKVSDAPDINTSPDLTIGLHLSKSLCENLWVTAYGLYQSKQIFSQYPLLIYNTSDPEWNRNEIYHISQPAYFKLDLSASYKWKMLDFSLLLKNVFDKRYRLNAEHTIVMQPGRTILGTLTVHF